MKRIVTIQDFSCVGSCSLTAAIPVLSAAGVECCGIPTALLSNHTGFPTFYSIDLTDELAPISDQLKREHIDFDGVYRNSRVWLNGHLLGFRPNGYVSFRYDLTPYLNYGKEENVLVVQADNSDQPNSRWYSGSGIYRNVWLVKTGQVHVDNWGTNITTPVMNADKSTVEIETL